jgi:hypothetical protein
MRGGIFPSWLLLAHSFLDLTLPPFCYCCYFLQRLAQDKAEKLRREVTQAQADAVMVGARTARMETVRRRLHCWRLSTARRLKPIKGPPPYGVSLWKHTGNGMWLRRIQAW